MTPEQLAQQAADTAEGWRQANIARVLSEMERYGLTIADLQNESESTKIDHPCEKGEHSTESALRVD